MQIFYAQAVHDFVLELGKTRAVLRKERLLGEAREARVGLDDEEVVDDGVQLVQPDFE